MPDRTLRLISTNERARYAPTPRRHALLIRERERVQRVARLMRAATCAR